MLLAYANVLSSDVREGEAREKELLLISEVEGKLAKVDHKVAFSS